MAMASPATSWRRESNSSAFEEGSLYPALHRMETADLIKAEWKASENNRRARYYSLTRAGGKRLAQEVKNWRQRSSAVAAFLDFA
jgi:PadR family transcriptional regulator PadR